MSIDSFLEEQKAQWVARIVEHGKAACYPGSLGHIKACVAEALYESVPMGIKVDMQVLPQTRHGIETIQIVLTSFYGEPVNPSRWYRIKRWFKRKWNA
jgi:hypothetical protein